MLDCQRTFPASLNEYLGRKGRVPGSKAQLEGAAEKWEPPQDVEEKESHGGQLRVIRQQGKGRPGDQFNWGVTRTRRKAL